MTANSTNYEVTNSDGFLSMQNGCLSFLKACFFVFLVWLLLAIGGIYYLFKSLLLIPDLGVRYSYADFAVFTEKTKVSFESPYEELCFNCPIIYQGEQPVKTTLSQEQISSWIQNLNSSKKFISKAQIKFNPDHAVEFSANVLHEGQIVPLYLRGYLMLESERSIALNLVSAKIGKIKVPSKYKDNISYKVEDFVNHKLAEMDGLSINKLEILDGFLLFEGTLPESVRGF